MKVGLQRSFALHTQRELRHNRPAWFAPMTREAPKIVSRLLLSNESPVSCSVAVPEHAGVLAALLAEATGRSVTLLLPTQTLKDRAASVLRWLLANGPQPRLFPVLPQWSSSPYEEVIENPYVAAMRLGALANLALSETPFAFSLDAQSAAVKVMPFSMFIESCVRLEVGRTIDLTWFVDHLGASGYSRVQIVQDVGEFAVRGGILDLFPPGLDEPVRLEFDGDVVSTIKAFDPITQRTTRPLVFAWAIPAWELPSDPSHFRGALLRLRDLAAHRGVPATALSKIESLLRAGRRPPGLPGMLATLLGRLDLVWNYIPEDSIVVVVDMTTCVAQADAALEQLRASYAEVRGGLCDEPEALRANGQALLTAFRSRPWTFILEISEREAILGGSPLPQTDLALATSADLPVSDRVEALCELLQTLLNRGDKVLVTCPTEEEARRVYDIIKARNIEASLGSRHGLTELLAETQGIRIVVGRVRSPFSAESLGVSVIPSEAIFGIKDVTALRRSRRTGREWLRDYHDLEPGCLVVHRDHGLGRFVALQEVSAAAHSTECLVIEYQGGDKLFVPLEKTHLLSRYVATPDAPPRPLDRLGSPMWQRRKAAARQAARDIADKLKALYAKRLSSTAFAIHPPGADFRQFEASFPFETTLDQDRTIEEIISDLSQDRPMDRVVCGDVGFGKTEIAIRAAYLVAMEGKQVAVLVPTTVLCEQHRVTFSARLTNTPLVVESLSRFRSQAEIRQILHDLRSGRIDIIIGTHRLLSRDVVFRDLGLLIIDEEHRFGVAHKERLREVAAAVHTLYLSATPIPRTLHMALSGIRDLSIIATPPRDRLAVKTIVAKESKELVRAAIMREINRGGQVFLVHNHIEDIYEKAAWVAEIVPEARVAVAHGRMTSRELEAVMAAFVRGEKDVLVCTTIIQSGLDIATANTIIIREADSFGLADLYQLRGRVGRSFEQAWCYLFVEDPVNLPEDAAKRIEAIERFSELSSGFNIAAMDLQIRGAGTIFGAEQSGHLHSVGPELFYEMIAEALEEVTERPLVRRPDPELKVPFEARLPAAFVADEATRLRLYRRLAGAKTVAEVRDIASEVCDCFGRMPVAAKNLFALMEAKVLARELGVSGLTVRSNKVEVRMARGFATKALVDAARDFGLRTEYTNDRVVVSLPSGVGTLEAVCGWLHAASQVSKIGDRES